MNIKKVRLFLFGLPKTLLFNFYYFPFKTAIKLLVWITHKVKLNKNEWESNFIIKRNTKGNG